MDALVRHRLADSDRRDRRFSIHSCLRHNRETDMTKTIAGLFPDFPEAQQVARELEKEGIPREDISILANDATREYATTAPPDEGGEMASGAGTGAAAGGAAGLAVSLAALAIPGIGPIVAAGSVATALTGAGIGAAAGGLIGGLTHMGIPEDDAHFFSEGVRNGGAVVIVRTPDSDHADAVADILERAGAAGVGERPELSDESDHV